MMSCGYSYAPQSRPPRPDVGLTRRRAQDREWLAAHAEDARSWLDEDEDENEQTVLTTSENQI